MFVFDLGKNNDIDKRNCASGRGGGGPEIHGLATTALDNVSNRFPEVREERLQI